MKRAFKIIGIVSAVVVGVFGIIFGIVAAVNAGKDNKTKPENLAFSSAAVETVNSFSLKIESMTENADSVAITLTADKSGIINFPSEVKLNETFTVWPIKENGSNVGGNVVLKANYGIIHAECKIFVDVEAVNVEATINTTGLAKDSENNYIIQPGSAVSFGATVTPARALNPTVLDDNTFNTNLKADKEIIYALCADEYYNSEGGFARLLPTDVAQFVYNGTPLTQNIFSTKDYSIENMRIVFLSTTIVNLKAYMHSTYAEQNLDTSTTLVDKTTSMIGYGSEYKEDYVGFNIGNVKPGSMTSLLTSLALYMEEDSKIYLRNTNSDGYNLGLYIRPTSNTVSDTYFDNQLVSINANYKIGTVEFGESGALKIAKAFDQANPLDSYFVITPTGELIGKNDLSLVLKLENGDNDLELTIPISIAYRALNPSIKYFETGKYVKTQDRNIVANKVYYSKSGDVYTKIETPIASSLSNYYEVDSSVDSSSIYFASASNTPLNLDDSFYNQNADLESGSQATLVNPAYGTKYTYSSNATYKTLKYFLPSNYTFEGNADEIKVTQVDVEPTVWAFNSKNRVNYYKTTPDTATILYLDNFREIGNAIAFSYKYGEMTSYINEIVYPTNTGAYLWNIYYNNAEHKYAFYKNTEWYLAECTTSALTSAGISGLPVSVQASINNKTSIFNGNTLYVVSTADNNYGLNKYTIADNPNMTFYANLLQRDGSIEIVDGIVYFGGYSDNIFTIYAKVVATYNGAPYLDSNADYVTITNDGELGIKFQVYDELDIEEIECFVNDCEYNFESKYTFDWSRKILYDNENIYYGPHSDTDVDNDIYVYRIGSDRYTITHSGVSKNGTQLLTRIYLYENENYSVAITKGTNSQIALNKNLSNMEISLSNNISDKNIYCGDSGSYYNQFESIGGSISSEGTSIISTPILESLKTLGSGANTVGDKAADIVITNDGSSYTKNVYIKDKRITEVVAGYYDEVSIPAEIIDNYCVIELNSKRYLCAGDNGFYTYTDGTDYYIVVGDETTHKTYKNNVITGVNITTNTSGKFVYSEDIDNFFYYFVTNTGDIETSGADITTKVADVVNTEISASPSDGKMNLNILSASSGQTYTIEITLADLSENAFIQDTTNTPFEDTDIVCQTVSLTIVVPTLTLSDATDSIGFKNNDILLSNVIEVKDGTTIVTDSSIEYVLANSLDSEYVKIVNKTDGYHLYCLKDLQQNRAITINVRLGNKIIGSKDISLTVPYTTKNITYALSSDTAVNPSKEYYTNASDVYIKVANPTGDPSALGYYEKTLNANTSSNRIALNAGKSYTLSKILDIKDLSSDKAIGYGRYFVFDGKVFGFTITGIQCEGADCSKDTSGDYYVYNNYYLRIVDKNSDEIPDTVEIYELNNYIADTSLQVTPQYDEGDFSGITVVIGGSTRSFGFATTGGSYSMQEEDVDITPEVFSGVTYWPISGTLYAFTITETAGVYSYGQMYRKELGLSTNFASNALDIKKMELTTTSKYVILIEDNLDVLHLNSDSIDATITMTIGSYTKEIYLHLTEIFDDNSIGLYDSQDENKEAVYADNGTNTIKIPALVSDINNHAITNIQATFVKLVSRENISPLPSSTFECDGKAFGYNAGAISYNGVALEQRAGYFVYNDQYAFKVEAEEIEVYNIESTGDLISSAYNNKTLTFESQNISSDMIIMANLHIVFGESSKEIYIDAYKVFGLRAKLRIEVKNDEINSGVSADVSTTSYLDCTSNTGAAVVATDILSGSTYALALGANADGNLQHVDRTTVADDDGKYYEYYYIKIDGVTKVTLKITYDAFLKFEKATLITGYVSEDYVCYLVVQYQSAEYRLPITVRPLVDMGYKITNSSSDPEIVDSNSSLNMLDDRFDISSNDGETRTPTMSLKAYDATGKLLSAEETENIAEINGSNVVINSNTADYILEIIASVEIKDVEETVLFSRSLSYYVAIRRDISFSTYYSYSNGNDYYILPHEFAEGIVYEVATLDYVDKYDVAYAGVNPKPGTASVYSLTLDTAIIAGKIYYIRTETEDNYIFTEVDPRASLYESAGADTYNATTDAIIVSNKTYYTRSGSEGSYIYSEVNPSTLDWYTMTSSIFYRKAIDDENKYKFDFDNRTFTFEKYKNTATKVEGVAKTYNLTISEWNGTTYVNSNYRVYLGDTSANVYLLQQTVPVSADKFLYGGDTFDVSTLVVGIAGLSNIKDNVYCLVDSSVAYIYVNTSDRTILSKFDHASIDYIYRDGELYQNNAKITKSNNIFEHLNGSYYESKGLFVDKDGYKVVSTISLGKNADENYIFTLNEHNYVLNYRLINNKIKLAYGDNTSANITKGNENVTITTGTTITKAYLVEDGDYYIYLVITWTKGSDNNITIVSAADIVAYSFAKHNYSSSSFVLANNIINIVGEDLVFNSSNSGMSYKISPTAAATPLTMGDYVSASGEVVDLDSLIKTDATYSTLVTISINDMGQGSEEYKTYNYQDIVTLYYTGEDIDDVIAGAYLGNRTTTNGRTFYALYYNTSNEIRLSTITECGGIVQAAIVVKASDKEIGSFAIINTAREG